MRFSFVSAHSASFMKTGSKLGGRVGRVCISIVGTGAKFLLAFPAIEVVGAMHQKVSKEFYLRKKKYKNIFENYDYLNVVFFRLNMC